MTFLNSVIFHGDLRRLVYGHRGFSEVAQGNRCVGGHYLFCSPPHKSCLVSHSSHTGGQGAPAELQRMKSEGPPLPRFLPLVDGNSFSHPLGGKTKR